jgi:hypothetical protein
VVSIASIKLRRKEEFIIIHSQKDHNALTTAFNLFKRGAEIILPKGWLESFNLLANSGLLSERLR